MTKMTKQQTITIKTPKGKILEVHLLSNNKVIEVTDYYDEKPSFKMKYDYNTLNDDSIQMIMKKISRSLHDSSELVDQDSAKFELNYNNTITLSSVDVDIDKILEIVEDELNDCVEQNSDIVQLERGEQIEQ